MVIKPAILNYQEALNSTHSLLFRWLRIAFYLVLFAIVSPQVVCSQPDLPGSDLLSTYLQAINIAINKALLNQVPLAEPLKKIRTEINHLENSLNSGRVIVSDSLVEGIGVAAEAAQKISADVSASEAATITGELLEDLKLKNAATDGMANLFGFGKSLDVLVHVNAMKCNVPQNGFSVKLIPNYYPKGNESNFASFDQLTPNAVKKLTPGRYRAILSIAGQPPVSELKQIEYASDNKATVEIDVTAE